MVIRSGQVFMAHEGKLYVLVGLKAADAPKTHDPGIPAFLAVPNQTLPPFYDDVPDGMRLGYATRLGPEPTQGTSHADEADTT